MPQRYSVVVAKDYLKFAAAHFIAYPGFREPLHGHNYQVSVRVEAELGADGYVLDFGLVKRVAKALCDELDERVLVPADSDCLTVVTDAVHVEMTTAEGDRFAFPRRDCAVLPIVHSSAEELDERVIVPERSDCLTIAVDAGRIQVTTAEGDRFQFPRADCAVLPIVHSSAEELAAYLLGRLRTILATEAGGRGLVALEVGVAEAPGQVAYCRAAC